MNPSPPHPAERHHQADVFRQIRLPVILTAAFPLLVAALLFVGWATGNLTPNQVTCVASGLAVLFIFIPLVLILVVINFLTLWLAYGSGSLYEALKPPLAQVRTYAEIGSSTTQKVSQRITEPVIAVRARVAYWRGVVLAPLDKYQKGKSDG